MNKKELVNVVAETSGITKVDAGNFVQAFMASITKALSKSEPITLVGFGSFQTVKRPARLCRDIRSGKPIKVISKKVIKFRTGSALSEKIQEIPK